MEKIWLSPGSSSMINANGFVIPLPIPTLHAWAPCDWLPCADRKLSRLAGGD
jgi:hypothetical protein